MDDMFDVAIIGGGINGAGCAADAALRGLSVVLFEQDDLASKTSSSSTKLIHGGLRYLEQYEFGLVKKAIAEQQRLLTLAPYLVHPQSFILPHKKHMRSAWLLRLGLFLYDHLSHKNYLPKSKRVKRKTNDLYFSPLTADNDNGFLYYDATTDDARLTITNALQAKNYGASIRPNSKVIYIETVNKHWRLSIRNQHGLIYKVNARTLINAAGPWVESIAQLSHIGIHHEVTLVKGSHIVVPKLYSGNHGYLLQHKDKRIIFVIPYHSVTLIGTTDMPCSNPSDTQGITKEETNYLIGLVNSYFNTQLATKNIIDSWSGIRSLLTSKDDNLSKISRDYHYEFNSTPAPIVTIYGGKLTTYRQLAEEVINQFRPIFPEMKPCATKNTPLPGTALREMTFKEYIRYAQTKYHWLDPSILDRYLHTYGCRTESFLANCTDVITMGQYFGNTLYQVEVDFLIAEEWANTLDDILKRRTKTGLKMSPQEKKKLEDYIKSTHSLLSSLSETLYH